LSADELDFTLSAEELPEERARLLRDAAGSLDRMQGHLGDGDADTEESEEAAVAREFAKDEAKMQRPEVYRVEDQRIEAVRPDLPVTVADQTRHWRFYWLSFPISLWTGEGRGFNQIQVKVDFNPEDDDSRRPRTLDILPNRQFVSRFKTESSLEVGLGLDLKFSAEMPVVQAGVPGLGVEAGGGGNAVVSGKTNLLLGPFGYEVRVPEVLHSNLGLDHARWRIDGVKFVREQDPGLHVILRVPRDDPRLVVKAQLRARRYFTVFETTLQDAFKQLPARLSAIFTGGAPIGHAPPAWDLTAEL
jgi:hypothetical protein